MIGCFFFPNINNGQQIMFYLKLNTYARSFPRKNFQNLTLMGQSVRIYLSQYIVANQLQGKSYQFILPSPLQIFNFYSLCQTVNHSLLSCDTRDWKEDGVLSECDAHGTHQSLRRSRSGIQPGRRNNSGHTLSEHQPPLTHLRVFPSTPNMWWFFQHQFSDSPTLSGYSTTQFNSDINYPEGLQTPQIKG